MAIVRPVKTHFFIHWLHAGYYEAAATLECYSCEKFWTQHDIVKMMHCHRFHGFVMVDTDFKKPVGYTICECFRKSGEVHLLNLVVHPSYRRQGLGSLLLDRVKTRLGDKFQVLTATVRESNTPTHLFLKKNGFLATGVIANHFEDQYDDAIEREDAFYFYYQEGRSHEELRINSSDPAGSDEFCSGR